MRLKLLFLLVVAGAAYLMSQGFTASSPAREYIYFGGKLVAMESVTSQAPAAVIYSPPNGTFSGPGGVFKVIVSDPNGAANLYQTNVMLGTSLDAATSCFLFYQHQWNQVFLYDPSTANWSAAMSLTPGVGSTTQLDSSLCTLFKTSSGGAYVSNQPTQFELSLNITLKPALANPVNIWTWVGDLQSQYFWWSILPPQPYTRNP